MLDFRRCQRPVPDYRPQLFQAALSLSTKRFQFNPTPGNLQTEESACCKELSYIDCSSQLDCLSPPSFLLGVNSRAPRHASAPCIGVECAAKLAVALSYRPSLDKNETGAQIALPCKLQLALPATAPLSFSLRLYLPKHFNRQGYQLLRIARASQPFCHHTVQCGEVT